MIVVTRLDRTQFAINPDLIERIYASPDTTLHLADSATYIVTESMGEVIDLITAYRARVIRLARDMASSPAGTGPGLSIVHGADGRSEDPAPQTPRK
jgi:flagellar protein FlbD